MQPWAGSRELLLRAAEEAASKAPSQRDASEKQPLRTRLSQSAFAILRYSSKRPLDQSPQVGAQPRTWAVKAEGCAFPTRTYMHEQAPEHSLEPEALRDQGVCVMLAPLHLRRYCREPAERGMSVNSVRATQLAWLHYASGDNAADRRADALALRNKLRHEYEHRFLEQDPMACARCGKELVRCLTKQDVTDCYYHRGELCATSTRNSRRAGVPRWSCCQLTGEGATGCQRGGRHKYEAIHPTFDYWFDNWATATGQGIDVARMRAPSAMSLETHRANVWVFAMGLFSPLVVPNGRCSQNAAAIPRDQVRNAAVLRAEDSSSVSSCGEGQVVDGHRLLPPRVRWVLTCQRAAWACCQHHRLGLGSPAFRLPPDLAAKVRSVDDRSSLATHHFCLDCCRTSAAALPRARVWCSGKSQRMHFANRLWDRCLIRL